MFCEKCGTQLEEGTLFCTNCGAKQDVPEVAPAFTQEAAPEGQAAPQAAPVAPAAPKQNVFKKIPVWGYIIFAVVLVAAIVGGIFLNKKMHTVDVADYINVEFDGYDTVGTASVELDEEFWEEVFDKASFKDKDRYVKADAFSSYWTEGDYMEEEIGKYFSYSLDKTSGLKNGDEVKLEFKVKAKKIQEKYGVTILADDKKFTVEGLEEADVFDPFEDIEVKFTGVSGDGECEIEIVNDRDVYDDIDFHCSDYYYLEEGDKITVEFGYYYTEDELTDYCVEKYGCIPTEKEKEYTVEGLGHYLVDASEVTSEASLGDMFEDGKTEITDEITSSYDDAVNVTAMDYVGIYAVDMTYGNYVFVVYKVTADVTDPDDVTTTVEYYTYCQFEDVAINDEGECSYNYNDGTPYSSFYAEVGDYTASFYGFETLEDLQDDMSYYENYYDATNNLGSSL